MDVWFGFCSTELTGTLLKTAHIACDCCEVFQCLPDLRRRSITNLLASNGGIEIFSWQTLVSSAEFSFVVPSSWAQSQCISFVRSPLLVSHGKAVRSWRHEGEWCVHKQTKLFVFKQVNKILADLLVEETLGLTSTSSSSESCKNFTEFFHHMLSSLLIMKDTRRVNSMQYTKETIATTLITWSIISVPFFIIHTYQWHHTYE